MSDLAVVFENVSKVYPIYSHVKRGFKSFFIHLPKIFRDMRNSKFEALKEVSFEIKKGETFGIIGKNGEGKSTILSLIAGVIKPTKGKVIVNGKVFPLLELGAGFHPELSGRENIILNGILLGHTKEEIMAKLDEIIEFSELGDFIDQPVRTYSSGMLARLGFSVMSSVETDILLIDEIFAVGDLHFQLKCFERMLKHKKNGTTIVFVSHDMDNVAKICDRVLWLDNHKIGLIGSAKGVIENYKKSFIE